MRGRSAPSDALDHLLDETIDELLAVSEVAALGEVIGFLPPSAASVVQLEVPQEIVGDFEVRSDGEDLVNQVLDADDAELAEPLLDDVVGEGASPTLKLSVAALVDELADRLEVGVTPGDVGIGDAQHAQRRLIQLHEGRVVDLTQTEELQHLSDSWVKSVDTSDSHDDGQLGLGGNVEVAVFAGISGQTEFLGLCRLVLLGVSLGLLENGDTLSLGRLLLEESRFELICAELSARLPLLQERLGNSGNSLSRHFLNKIISFTFLLKF